MTCGDAQVTFLVAFVAIRPAARLPYVRVMASVNDAFNAGLAPVAFAPARVSATPVPAAIRPFSPARTIRPPLLALSTRRTGRAGGRAPGYSPGALPPRATALAWTAKYQAWNASWGLDGIAEHSPARHRSRGGRGPARGVEPLDHCGRPDTHLGTDGDHVRDFRSEAEARAPRNVSSGARVRATRLAAFERIKSRRLSKQKRGALRHLFPSGVRSPVLT